MPALFFKEWMCYFMDLLSGNHRSKFRSNPLLFRDFSINQVSWHYNPKGLSYKLQEAVLSKWSQALLQPVYDSIYCLSVTRFLLFESLTVQEKTASEEHKAWRGGITQRDRDKCSRGWCACRRTVLRAVYVRGCKIHEVHRQVVAVSSWNKHQSVNSLFLFRQQHSSLFCTVTLDELQRPLLTSHLMDWLQIWWVHGMLQ